MQFTSTSQKAYELESNMTVLTRRKIDRNFLNSEKRGGGLLMIRKLQTRHILKHIDYYGTL